MKEHYVLDDRFAETVFATNNWWIKTLKNFELVEMVPQNRCLLLSSRIHYVFRRKE
jgi:hypothetical protein